MEIKYPEHRTYYVARSENGGVLHTGQTMPNQVTTTGQPVLDVGDTESDQLGNLSGFTDLFPEMPEAGKSLSSGEVYRYNNVLYMVRQDHARTEDDPADVLALFLTHNPDGTDWIAGEQVQVDTIRNHEGKTWRAKQSHVTQAGWEPANVPALWGEIVNVPDEPQPWVQPTGTHDAYALGAKVRHNGKNWENTSSAANVWEPGVFGWIEI
jgi:hypothetical protein